LFSLATITDLTWDKCSKIGHIAKACKSSRYQKYSSNTHQRDDNVNTFLRFSYDSTDPDTVPLYTVYSSEGNSAEIMVPVETEGTKITFIVDAGAARSIISESLYHNHLSLLALQTPESILTGYLGDRIPMLGEVITHLRYQNQSFKLSLLIARGNNKVPLFDRDWMKFIHLNWKSIFQVMP